MKKYLVRTFFAYDVYCENYDEDYCVVDECVLTEHGFQGDVGIFDVEPEDDEDYGGMTYWWAPINEDGTVSLSCIEHLVGTEIGSEIPKLEDYLFDSLEEIFKEEEQ